jgi:hypothetical protein
VILTDQVKAAIASNQAFWSDGKMVLVIREERVITVVEVAELKEAA